MNSGDVSHTRMGPEESVDLGGVCRLCFVKMGGDRLDPKSAGESLKPAFGATLGRVLGTCCKVLIAVMVWAVLGYGLLSA